MTIPGVHFVSDSRGRTTAVLIDLTVKRHQRLWEDLYDAMIGPATPRRAARGLGGRQEAVAGSARPAWVGTGYR